ncbi:helix-turn-helix domain-containing protein [Maricaulis alexandrii]|uniref:helix-turn-helix domain-containing protein n=1 Tax=Maricaulis alexandrii TaxID=2570354 RepID=UPI0011099563
MERLSWCRLTLERRREHWLRWKRGETLAEIGAVLGGSTPNVFQILKAAGGIAPRERRVRPGSLDLDEREEISRELAAGLSLRAIGRRLGRAPSTVSREVDHDGGRQAYRALAAQAGAVRGVPAGPRPACRPWVRSCAIRWQPDLSRSGRRSRLLAG